MVLLLSFWDPNWFHNLPLDHKMHENKGDDCLVYWFILKDN